MNPGCLMEKICERRCYREVQHLCVKLQHLRPIKNGKLFIISFELFLKEMDAFYNNLSRLLNIRGCIRMAAGSWVGWQ